MNRVRRSRESWGGGFRSPGKRWAALHRWVYVAGTLAVVHFFIQSKADVTEPFVMGGLFVWLMGWRLLARRGLLKGRTIIVEALILVSLAAVSAAMAAAAEGLYYHWKTGVDVTRVLAVNFTSGPGIRPSWVVGAVGLTVVIGALLRPLWVNRPRLS